jgi:hypothetical protein
MNAFPNFRGSFRRLLFSLPAAWLIISGGSTRAQTLTLNVTNYGARGDAVQIWASTVSNSAVVTFTNKLTAADIGKAIELFGVGAINIGPNVNNVNATNNQDLIAVITNVVNGTNVYISGDIPKKTASGVYCIYGTDNSPAFQAAVNAATGTNTIINIPAGTFLMIPAEQYTNFTYTYYPYAVNDCAFKITKGGMHFVGASRDSTVLMADGAFKNQGYACMRGFIFNCVGPITNDYPLIFDSLTFDAGLQTGLIGYEGVQPADWVDGLGWDGFSAAGLDSGSEPLNTFKEFVNCKFQHFRGEMIKGITGSAGKETILVTNCFFLDGNATAFNYNFAHTITGCTFSNMYQIEEFYLAYPTNAPSYFVNNYATNILHNLISLNGGTLTNEPYIVSNNVFYCDMNGNGIATCPASSVFVTSNLFIQDYGYHTIAFAIGEAGAQPGSPTACNTNIIIAGNTFSNAFYTYFGIGDNAVSSTDQNRADNVQIYGNILIGAANTDFMDTGWANNINIYSNDAAGVKLSITSGGYGSPFAVVNTNNNYYGWVLMDGEQGFTNNLSYGNGSRWLLTYPFSPSMVVALVDTNGSQIPTGAQMLVSNANSSGSNSLVYLNSAMTSRIVLPYNQAQSFYWTNNSWAAYGAQVFYWTNGTWTSDIPSPPTNLHVVPGS